MEDNLEEFKKTSERAKENGGRVRYSQEMRSFAVEFTKERLGRGMSLAAAAKELGVSDMTLKKWLQRSGAFKEVRIRPEKGNSSNVTLVTPSGYRIEGLDIESLTCILRKIG
jgi:transposase-like protein